MLTTYPTSVIRSFAAIAVILFAFGASLAQEPYSGSQKFAVGDLVEATELGEWKKAVVVGPLVTDEFGSTYEIRFEGAKHSAGRINAKWVRPRGEDNAAAVVDDRVGPARPETPASGEVMYSGGGPVWIGGARIVEYDAAKRQYRIITKSGSGDIVPCHSIMKPGEIDNSFFIGSWAVFVSGSASTFSKGNSLYRQFSGGMKLPPLQIKPDGTYIWRTDGGKILRGKWSPRDGVPGITIHNGLDGKDWTVYESTEGYAPTAKTLDEIRFHHIPSSTGYYLAYRTGENKSCVLRGRTF